MPLEKIRADPDLVYSVAAVSGFVVCSSQWNSDIDRESDPLWSRTAWCKRPRGSHSGHLQLRVRCAYQAVSGKRGYVDLARGRPAGEHDGGSRSLGSSLCIPSHQFLVP